MSQPDVDIDLKERDRVLDLFPLAAQASQMERKNLQPHKTGLYFQAVPIDPITGLCAYPYEIAEDIGYYKVDFLPNHVYDRVRDPDHLDELVSTPTNWDVFLDAEFVHTLFHFGGQIDKTLRMADVVAAWGPTNMHDLAMLVAVKLPAKRHLLTDDWGNIPNLIWEPDSKKRAQFKKAHAYAYAMVIDVDAKLRWPEWQALKSTETPDIFD